MERREGPEGQTLFVDPDDTERGTSGPFFVTYEDDEARVQWGYFCGNCETFDNAMDPMGRIRCNACSNVRKPEEWDAAHE